MLDFGLQDQVGCVLKLCPWKQLSEGPPGLRARYRNPNHSPPVEKSEVLFNASDCWYGTLQKKHKV